MHRRDVPREAAARTCPLQEGSRSGGIVAMARVALVALLVGGALGFLLGRVSDASTPDGGREAEEHTSAPLIVVDRDVAEAHDHDHDTDEAHDHDRDVDEDDEADERAREQARRTRTTPSADELARRPVHVAIDVRSNHQIKSIESSDRINRMIIR